MGAIKPVVQHADFLYVAKDAQGQEQVKVAKYGKVEWLKAHVFSKAAFSISHVMKVLGTDHTKAEALLDAGAFKRYTVTNARRVHVQSFALVHVILPKFREAMGKGDRVAIEKLLEYIAKNGFRPDECLAYLRDAAETAPSNERFKTTVVGFCERVLGRYQAAQDGLKNSYDMYGLRPIDLLHICIVGEKALEQASTATVPLGVEHIKKDPAMGLVRSIVVDPSTQDILIQVKGKRRVPFRKEGASKKVTEAILLSGQRMSGAWEKPRILVQAVNLKDAVLPANEIALMRQFGGMKNLMSVQSTHSRPLPKKPVPKKPPGAAPEAAAAAPAPTVKRSYFQEKGTDAEAWLTTARSKALAGNVEDQMAIVTGLANGMRELHAFRNDDYPAGIVHNDIKLQNLIMTTGPTGELIPKISDFGQVNGADQPQGKRAGSPAPVYSTFEYMAPELLSNLLRTVHSAVRGQAPPDASAIADTRGQDMYAMGLSMYQLICARQNRVDRDLAARLEETLSKIGDVWAKQGENAVEKCLALLVEALQIQEKIAQRARPLYDKIQMGIPLTPQEKVNLQIYSLLSLNPKDRPDASAFFYSTKHCFS